MAGCTQCGDGRLRCNDREAEKAALCETWTARLYPTKAWNQLDDDARVGITRSEAQTLGQSLSRTLRAPVYLVPGEADDLCSLLYVLCVGRHPGAIMWLRGEIDEAIDSKSIRESYLRVCLSRAVRAACVQEVRLFVDGNESGFIVEERPRDGVFDATLLHRVRALTELLALHDIEHMDMGVLEASPKGYDVREYVRRFGVEPTYFNWLFLTAPVTTTWARTFPTTSSAHEQA